MKKDIIIAIITGIFITIAAVISSPQWFKYFFPDQYLEQEQITPIKTKSNLKTKESQDQKDSVTNTAIIVISRIELSPKKFKIPSYFYFEVINKGTRTLENVEVTIDLGKTNYEQFDLSRKIKIISIVDSLDKSFVKLKIPKIKPKESFDFYSLLNYPIFNSIVINASNMKYDKTYTYKEFIDSESESSSSWFFEALKILFFLVTIAFAVFFTVLIFILLTRRFNM